MKDDLYEYIPRRFELKSYTRKEMQHIYGVPYRTFQRWLEPFKDKWGIKHNQYLTIEQVRKIVEEFGIPGELVSK
jgi:transposase